jgi:hypothetical protein
MTECDVHGSRQSIIDHCQLCTDLMIWALCYTRLSYHEQTERAIGQIYVSITTNDLLMVTYQIQQVYLYKGSQSNMCNWMD